MSQGPEATEVIVIRGYGYDAKHRMNNQRLIVERALSDIAEVAELVTGIIPGSERADWMEMPSVSVVFLEGRSVLKEYGLLGGLNYVRLPEGEGDYPLSRPDAMREWLLHRMPEDRPLAELD